MKKIIIGFLLGVMAAGFAQALDLELSGEIKTGFYAEQQVREDGTNYRTMMFNNEEDSNAERGGNRFRLGMGLQQGNFGLRMQLYQEDFRRKTSAGDPNVHRIQMDYAYAYGNLLNNQIKISAGLLGESPWGSGGPKLLQEVETDAGGYSIMGIRFEFKPYFVPGLNVGFVLDRDNDAPAEQSKEKFGDIFQESILGIAYEHDYFALRFAYRFDRELESPAAVVYGTQFVYRLEERILGKLLPGMHIWANGFCKGIGAIEGPQGGRPQSFIKNWLYATYEPEYFNSGFEVRYEDWFESNAQTLELRPYFYYKFFKNLLSVGMMGGMEMGLNENGKSLEDAFYNFWFLEPQIKVNIGSNLSAALVYRYTSGSFNSQNQKDQNTHWVNIRVCYTF